MIDGQRVYPVNEFFLHHSTGPDFVNASDLEVQDWFDNTGKSRGYTINGIVVSSNHEHPSRKGKQTYAMAQFALRAYTKDGNKYGFRLTDLMNNPWQNVAWAVGNWDHNTRSCSVEVCGNFTNKILPDKGLMLLADFLRPIDKELNGALSVMLHQEVFATACPARIKEQREKLVDMINNPDKWNKTLWPPTPPKPVVTVKDEYKTSQIPFGKNTVESDIVPKGTIQTTPGVVGLRAVSYRVTYTDGKETARVVTADVVTREPVDEITTVGTYEPVTEIPSDEYPSWFVQFWLKLVELIKNLVTKKGR